MQDDLTTLNRLTDTAIDSAMGYEQAANRAKSAELKAILTSQAARRRQTVALLNDELVRLGGAARQDGSTLGWMHRGFLAIADAFGDSDEAAVERVEEGEDYIEKEFSKAIEANPFDPATLDVLRRAHSEIREGEALTDRLEKQYD